MQRESQKDRTILCKYDPTEPGDYRMEVKWSGEHVPGSPFVVMIFDTQDELNRYMAVSNFVFQDHKCLYFCNEIYSSILTWDYMFVCFTGWIFSNWPRRCSK